MAQQLELLINPNHKAVLVLLSQDDLDVGEEYDESDQNWYVSSIARCTETLVPQ